MYIYNHFTLQLGTSRIYFSLFHIEIEKTVAGLMGEGWGEGGGVVKGIYHLPPPPPSKITGGWLPPPPPTPLSSPLFLSLWGYNYWWSAFRCEGSSGYLLHTVTFLFFFSFPPDQLIGLNNIYFEKLSHTNVQNEQSGFGRKLQACKDHLPKKDHLLN